MRNDMLYNIFLQIEPLRRRYRSTAGAKQIAVKKLKDPGPQYLLTLGTRV